MDDIAKVRRTLQVHAKRKAAKPGGRKWQMLRSLEDALVTSLSPADWAAYCEAIRPQ